jgi:hypothetical protein
MMVAVAVLPAPPSLDTTVLVVLVFVPALVARTVTENVHTPLGAIVPPDSEIDVPPPLTVTVPAPHAVAGPLNISRPPGIVSVNATPVNGVAALGFVIVKVSDVVLPAVIAAAPNTLLITGGAGLFTMMVAVAVLPAPPSLDITVLVVLVFVPALVAVMVTENVHTPLGAIVPPDSEIYVPPPLTVTVPAPHAVAGALDITKPAGIVSVNATAARPRRAATCACP